MNKKFLVSLSVVAGLIAAVGMNVLPASAGPGFVSVVLSPDSVESGGTINMVINNNPSTGQVYFVGCMMTSTNGVNYRGLDKVVSGDPVTSHLSSGLAPIPNYDLANFTASDLSVKLRFFSGISCADVTDVTVPFLESNAVTISPLLTFAPVNLVEGDVVTTALPYTLTGTFFDWTWGSNTTIVTANNCAPRSVDSLFDEALTTLPLGLSVTSNAIDAAHVAPTLIVAGTVPEGSAGTYQACVSIVDGNLSTANAWVTFNVAAPAVLAETGVDASALIGDSGLAGGLLIAGLAALMALRRRRGAL